METDRDTANKYRLRAEQLRTIASTLPDKPSREILQGIAEDYDRMARSRDASDGTGRSFTDGLMFSPSGKRPSENGKAS